MMKTDAKFHKKHTHPQEKSITGCNLILDGDDSMRECENVSGDALGLLLHQLFLLPILLLQGGQPCRLLLLEKLPELLKLLSDLLLCGCSLVLEHVGRWKHGIHLCCNIRKSTLLRFNQCVKHLH